VGLDTLPEGDLKITPLGGIWTGGGYAFAGEPSADCSDDVRAFVSFAVGMRGEEVYFTPKLGVVSIPAFCISLGNGGW
jgi:hypothetical protein